MARVKRSVNAKKKRRTVLEQASGYRGQRSRMYRKAKEQVTHSFVYSYRDRKAKKGDFRRLWIQRINAASRAQGLTYNRLIQGLRGSRPSHAGRAGRERHQRVQRPGEGCQGRAARRRQRPQGLIGELFSRAPDPSR